MTDTDTPAPAAEPIPTEPQALYHFLRKLPPGAQAQTADLLGVQLGGTPEAIERACDLVDRELRVIAHEDEIVERRGEFADALAAGVQAVIDARHTLARLIELYDVEYAEGGQDVLDLTAFLDDAARMFRAAVKLNPCPPGAAQ
ncbi:hypothetical protein ACIBTV_27455 [Micromonospora sp. NPDC049366]|uniref:hypothetical protein n=1 Tax=Micromonospora sp. NPDC049366 TaxID=3364271 RepID=UPI0037B48BE1